MALGKDPYDLMVAWTETQLVVFLTWLNDQWNEPDRTDHYLMQVAQQVRLAQSKKRLRLEKFKIPFKFRGSQPVTQDEIDRRTAISKAHWKFVIDNPGPRPLIAEGKRDGA